MDEVKTLKDYVRSHIEEVLKRCNGNKTHAARALGVDRRTLYRYLQRYCVKIRISESTAEAAADEIK